MPGPPCPRPEPEPRCNDHFDCNGHGCNDDGGCNCCPGFTGDCSQCEVDMYGPSCQTFCSDFETCSGNGFCAGNGQCECFPGFTGSGCEQCAEGYHGEDCDIFTPCDPMETCNGGLCLGDGSCLCAPGFVGVNCEECADGLYGDNCESCNADVDCNGKGMCIGDGSCMCFDGFAGSSCSECANGRVGEGCDVECDSETTCSGNGMCLGDGTCMCLMGYGGVDCGDCAVDFYGESCDMSCTAEETCSAHGMCVEDGRCACDHSFAGAQCAHCENGLYGPNCDRGCDEEDNCNNRGICDGEGLCLCMFPFDGHDCTDCVAGHYGEDCLKVCTSHDTCSDNGVCNAHGDCLCDIGFSGTHCAHCDDGWYGQHCGQYCKEETTCSGHGICDHDGHCVCDSDEFYDGEHCDPIPVRPDAPILEDMVVQEGYDTLVWSWRHANELAVLQENPMRVQNYVWEAKVCYLECSNMSGSGSDQSSAPDEPKELIFNYMEHDSEKLGIAMANEVLRVPYPAEAPASRTCVDVCDTSPRFSGEVHVPYRGEECVADPQCDMQGCTIELSGLEVGARVYFDVRAQNMYNHSNPAEGIEDVLEKPAQPEPTVEVVLGASEAEAVMTVSWNWTDFGDRRQRHGPYRTNFCYLVTFSVTGEWGPEEPAPLEPKELVLNDCCECTSNSCNRGNGNGNCDRPSSPRECNDLFDCNALCPSEDGNEPAGRRSRRAARRTLREASADVCVTEQHVGSGDMAELVLNVGWARSNDVFYIDFGHGNDTVKLLEGGAGGDTIEITVAGKNSLFTGEAGETQYVILGLPEKPAFEIEELDSGVEVTWTSPEDTGYGDDSINVTTFIAVSSCIEFDDESPDCRVTEVALHLGRGDHSHIFPEDVLVPNTINYIRMRFMNIRGLSQDLIIPLWYKLVPILLAPDSLAKPSVALLEDGVSVWQRGVLGGSTFMVMMQGFITSPADEELFEGTVWIPDLEGTAFSGTISNIVYGENRVATFDFEVPRDIDAVCGKECDAIVVFGAATSKTVLRFPIRYFTYPAPEATIFPRMGSRGGNVRTLLKVTEFFGPRTREGAGLPYLNAESTISASFACVGEDISAPAAAITADFDKNPIEFSITTPESPCSEDIEDTLVQLFMDGELVQLGGQAGLVYSFKGPSVISVTPAAAFIPVGNEEELDIRVDFLGLCFAGDCGPRPVGNVSQLVVTLGGQRCPILSVSQATTSVILTVQAPGLPLELAGTTLDVVVTYPGREVNPADFFFSAPPPARVLRSRTLIDGEAKFWMALDEDNVVEISVNNLLPEYRRAFVSLNVSFNDAVYEVTSFSQIGQITQFAVTHTPSALADAVVVIEAIGSDGNVVAVVDKTDLGGDFILQVRNTRLPRLVSFNPTLMVSRGGTFLLATIEQGRSLHENPSLLMSTIEFDCGNSSKPTLQEIIPYSSWTSEDQEYEQVVSSSGFSEYRLAASTARKSSYSAAVRGLTTTSVVVLFQMPAAVCAQTASMVLTAGNTTVGTIDLDVAGVLTGPATVSSATTPEGTAESAMTGGSILTLTLTDFSVVESADQVMIIWNGEEVEVLELVRSSLERTVLRVSVPSALTPGDVDVDVYPAFEPANKGSFSFTYTNDQAPEVSSFAPSEGYADGGWTVTVEVARMLLDGNVSCSVGGTPVIVTVLSASSLTFVTPLGSPGRLPVTISTAMDAVSFTLDYKQIPAGAPEILSVTPPTGSMSGGFVAVAAVNSMRKVSGARDVGLMFGGVEIDLSSDPNVQVISNYQATFVTFTVPPSSSIGEVELKIWNVNYADLQGSFMFEYIDADAPSLEYVQPREGPKEASVTVSVGLKVYREFSSFEVTAPSGVTATVAGFTERESNGVVVDVTVIGSTSGTFELELRVCTAEGVCESPLPFDFVFFDAAAPRVLEAFPSQIKLYGTVSLTVRMSNLPEDVTKEGITLRTAVGAFVANSIVRGPNADSIVFTVPPQEDVPAKLDASISIPSITFNANLTALRVVDPGTIRIAEIAPASAFTTERTEVTARVRNFPGITSNAVVVLVLEKEEPDEDPVSIDLQLVSVEKLGSSTQPSATQDVNMVFVSPVGEDVSAGTWLLRVYHIDYEYFSATAPFEFMDALAPRVINIVSVFGGENSNSVRMSESTDVTLIVSNPPTDVATDEYLVYIGGVSVPIVSVLLFVEEGQESSVLVIVSVPRSTVEGSVAGLITFGESECTAACCPGSCSEACGVPTACFSVSYFDDLVPFVTGAPSVTSGPEVGGTRIEVTAANFPIVTDSDMIATFGRAGAAGTVLVIESTAEATRFVVIAPPYDIGDAGSLDVTVTLVSSTSGSASVTFGFTYEAATVALVQALPTRGVENGGVRVQVDIENFPFPSTPLVLFGSTTIADENVTVVPQSNARKTLITFLTPKTPTGTYEVTVSPKGCSSPCSDQVKFDFFQRSALAMELVDPIPSRGSQQLNLPIEVFVRNFPTFVTNLADIDVGAVGSETGSLTGAAVTAMQDRRNSKKLTIQLPSGFAIGETVSITITANEQVPSVSFDFFLFDGTALRTLTTETVTAPVSKTIYGKQVDLRTTVEARVANWPQHATDPSVYLFNEVLSTQVSADLVSVVNTVTCLPPDVGCNRTRITVLLPATYSTGVRKLMVSHPDVGTFQLGEVAYVAGCNWETFCGSQIADYKQISGDVGTQCRNQYCIPLGSILEASLTNPTPTRGLSSGGNTVVVDFANFPAVATTDLRVEFRTGGSVYPSSVSSFTEDAGASVASNSGTMSILTPSVNNDAGVATVTVSMSSGEADWTASFDFEYRPVITGPAKLLSTNQFPARIFPSTPFILVMAFANVPQFDLPYRPSSIRAIFGGQEAVDSQIILSSRAATLFTVEGTPDTTWPVGELAVTAFLPLTGVARGVTFNVTVLPTPDVIATTPTPAFGRSDTQHRLSFQVWYLDPVLDISNVSSVEMSTADLTGAITTTALETVSMSSLNGDGTEEGDCFFADCSKFILTVRTPATNPSGSDLGGVANISVTIGGETVGVQFTYRASGEAYLSSLMPQSEPVVLDAGEQPTVMVALGNFPSAACKSTGSCSTEAAGATVVFDYGDSQASGTILGFLDTAGLLRVSVRAPLVQRPTAAKVTIAVGETSVTFDYRYTAAAAYATPLDGANLGGSVITITSYALMSVPYTTNNSAYITATIDRQAARVVSIYHNESWLMVDVVVPASSKTSLVTGKIHFDDPNDMIPRSSASFKFLYFATPTVAISPSSATTDGRTNQPNEGSRRATLTLSSFPRVDTVEDISVFFGDVELSVLKITNRVAAVPSGTIRQTELSVAVPAAAAGSVPVTVTFQGALAVPRSLTVPPEFYGRAKRHAMSSFTYFVPVPKVSSVRWCSSCATTSVCHIAGQCGDGVAPSQGLPVSTQGVVTVNFENAPAILDENGTIPEGSSVDIQFGSSFGTDVQIVRENRDRYRTTLRVVPPAFFSTGPVSMTVTMTKGERQWSASYDVDVIDDTLTLECLGICSSPMFDAPAFVVAMENLPVSADPTTATEQIAVEFEGLIFGKQLLPKQYSVISSNTSTITLSITPPDCDDCFTISGMSFFWLTVSLQEDPTVRVRTAYIFAAPPKALGAWFDPTGSALFVLFDQLTDLGGMYGNNTDCNQIFHEDSVRSFGNSSMCIWVSYEILVVILADGPTVLPDDVLRMKTVRNILQISGETTTTPTVYRPLEPRFPALMLSGPAEIDNCASLEINTVSSSSRDLIYSWRGVDPSVDPEDYSDADIAFDAAVSATTDSRLFLDAFTPEMEECDHTYSIAVSVTDFLGFTSEELVFTVFKRCLPGLELMLQPSLLQVDRSSTISVEAQTQFSPCRETGEMLYQWSLTDPSLETPELLTYLATDLVELYIPPMVLTAGVDYTVQCVVTLATDLTVTNTAIMTIQVLPQDLVAMIAGGEIKWGSGANATANLKLDASLSRDPDVNSADPELQGLNFTWECSYDDGTVRDVCLDFNGNVLVIPSVAAPELPPGSLRSSETTPYEFTVTVSKAGRAPAQATVPVYVFGESAIPVVTIDIGESRKFNADGTVTIKPSDLMVMTSTCDGTGSRAWSVDPEVDMSTDAWAGVSTEQLTMFADSYSLMGGAQYTLTHSCTVNGQTGSASVKLKVNMPPTGGSCDVCYQNKKGKRDKKEKCKKGGKKSKALDTVFELTCSNWADSDGESSDLLQYSFGYRDEDETNNDNAVWSAAGTDNFNSMVFPSGRWVILARIFDSSDVNAAYTEVEIGDINIKGKKDKKGDSGKDWDRRRLLSDEASNRHLLQDGAECQVYRDDWAGYKAQIDEILLTKNAGRLFDQVGLTVAEIKTGAVEANVNGTCGELAMDAVTSVEQAAAAMLLSLDNAVINQDFVVLAMNKARRVIAGTEFQSIHSAGNITALARGMLEGLALVSVDASVVTDLVHVVQSGIQIWTANKDQDALNFLSDVDVATVEATRRLAINMGLGEANDYSCENGGNNALCTQLSTNYLRKRRVSEVAQMEAATPNSIMSSLEMHNVTVMLPDDLAMEMGNISGDAEISVYMSVHQQLPLAGGMTFHSPLFSVSIYDSNEAVYPLTQLNDNVDIMIPLLDHNRTKNEEMRFAAQAGCMYWDHSMHMFSDEGCQSSKVTDKFMVCSCDHLTMFAIVQNVTGACGDGMLESQFEGCDDGNLVTGDGCNSDCEVESYYSCSQDNGNNQPSVCTLSTIPAFSAAISDSTNLQGASNTISVRLFTSAPLRKGGTITMSGFVGTETGGSTIALSVATASEGIVPNISTWDQSTGTLQFVLEKETLVADTIKFSFVVKNPVQNNPAANVTISCGDCLVKESYSSLQMASAMKQTNVLHIEFVAPACTNTSLFGANCAYTCVYGTVVGSRCVCPDGVFGATCNQVATLLASEHLLLNASTSNSLSLSGRRSTGASFTIPAGAIAADDVVEVTISLYDTAPTPDASLQTEEGGILANGLAVVMSPRGQTFLKNITLSLPYDSAAVPNANASLSTWAPTGHWLDTTTGIWEDLGGTINGNVIDTPVDHFTTFAVMVEEMYPATKPAFTNAIISDETELPGVRNELSVRLFFNAPLQKDGTVTISGFLGANTPDTAAMTIEVEPASSSTAALTTTAQWTQATGALVVKLARDVARDEQIKFYFSLTNPVTDNTASTVTVSCASCLKNDARSTLTMGSFTKATAVLETAAAVATCTDSSMYGASCSQTCFGVVIGSTCTCPPGLFGGDCSQQGTVLQRASSVINPSTQTETVAVTLPDGQGVNVPAGSLPGTDEIEVSVKLYDVAPTPLSSSALKPNGRAQVYGPRGIEFLQDVLLILDYDATKHDTSSYSVKGHWLNKATGIWEGLTSGLINNGFVESPVDHFSTFASMLTPTPAPITTTPKPDDDDDDDRNIGAIVGGVLAGWAVLIAAIVFCFWKRRQQKQPVLPKAEPVGDVVLNDVPVAPIPPSEPSMEDRGVGLFPASPPIQPYQPMWNTSPSQPVVQSQMQYFNPVYVPMPPSGGAGYYNPMEMPPMMQPPMMQPAMMQGSMAPMQPPMMQGMGSMPPMQAFGPTMQLNNFAGGSVPPMQGQFGSSPPMFGQQPNQGYPTTWI